MCVCARADVPKKRLNVSKIYLRSTLLSFERKWSPLMPNGVWANVRNILANFFAWFMLFLFLAKFIDTCLATAFRLFVSFYLLAGVSFAGHFRYSTFFFLQSLFWLSLFAAVCIMLCECASVKTVRIFTIFAIFPTQRNSFPVLSRVTLLFVVYGGLVKSVEPPVSVRFQMGFRIIIWWRCEFQTWIDINRQK